jgi:hypothetical protein
VVVPQTPVQKLDSWSAKLLKDLGDANILSTRMHGLQCSSEPGFSVGCAYMCPHDVCMSCLPSNECI